MNLKNRDFLKLLDYTSEEIRYLLDLSHDFKKKKQQGIEHKYLKGKNIALLFEKTSTRTRCAFEVAAADLGMHSTYLDPVSSQMGKKESIEDEGPPRTKEIPWTAAPVPPHILQPSLPSIFLSPTPTQNTRSFPTLCAPLATPWRLT